MPFHPNVGIGGHCIPVDPLYLQARAADFGLSSKYIAVSEEINHAMPKFVVDRLSEEVGGLSDKKVLVVGVSYKAEIADTRETPATRLLSNGMGSDPVQLMVITILQLFWLHTHLSL
jgi:UDP-N-acetyl-D-glucosamine dehydrogenase